MVIHLCTGQRAVADNAPYVALTVALCATRLVPPLRDFLKPLWALKPYDNQPAFAPLYAPGFWLLSIGIIVVFRARASLAKVAAETAKGAWRSCAVTLAFVVMAELYVGSGMAQQIAEALRAVAGRGAALSVPLFAATGGIALVYLANFVMGFFGAGIPLIHGGGPVGIAFSLVVVGVAACIGQRGPGRVAHGDVQRIGV